MLLVATLVGISNAGIALAHGHAHHEAHERAVAHAEAHGHEVHAPDGEHDHPTIALGASARVDSQIVFLSSVETATGDAAISEFVQAPPAASLLTAIASARASPQRPRAPPHA